MAGSARTLRVGAQRALSFGNNLLRLHGVSGTRVSPDDVAVALVHAAHPSVLGLLPLSLVDTELMCDAPTQSWTFFYEAGLDADALQAALSRALTAYPLLAGRLVKLPDDAHGRRRVAVACDNEGALFSHLHLPSVALPTSRGAQSGELPAWAAGWAGPPTLEKLLKDPAAPLLEVLLVTYARGCSLCVKFSHVVADGQSMVTFLACWSRTYADPGAPLPSPLMDRTAQDEQMKHGSAVEADSECTPCTCAGAPRAVASPNGGIVDRLSAMTMARLAMRAVLDPSMGFHPNSRAVVGACFHLSGAQLARIKRTAAAHEVAPSEAQAEDGAVDVAGIEPSTFDALAGLLWRSLALARKHRGALDRARLEPPRLFFSADVRGRMDPPLPYDSVGNFITGVTVQLEAETMRTGGLGTVAAAVHRSKAAAVTAVSITQELAYLDAQTRCGRKKRCAVNPYDGEMLLTDWRFPNAPLYTAANFGAATPFWFEPAIDDAQRWPYFVCIMPSPPGSAAPGLTAFVFLPADELPAVMRSMAEAAC